MSRPPFPGSRVTSLLLVIALVAPFAVAAEAPASDPDLDLDQAAAWIAGDFDTFDQVDADERAGASYVHVRVVLHAVPVAIAGLTSEGIRAFYVEQAAAGAEDRPYRQRVYLLHRSGGTLVNDIYRIGEPEQLAGARSGDPRLETLTPGRLVLEPGCTLVWTRIGPTLFSGIAGLGGSCRTTHRGASSIVSQALLTPDRLISLDQGFDAQGSHVWGPPPGTIGHEFRRRESQRDGAAPAQPAAARTQAASTPPLTR